MLIGRVFSAFVSPEQVPFMINLLSGVASAATIMFLFWTITHFAKKIADAQNAVLSSGKVVAIIGSGVVGALAYTFSDTFWYSAVEGEVYALSSLFTAVVFWAILKWESLATPANNELRWVVLIAYLMGLSIGVHLLNLLAIPAICFVYYYKNYTVTRKGVVATGFVALGLLALIQTGVIIWFVKLAGVSEKLFVNSFGLPFNSGLLFYLLLVIGLIVLGLTWAKKKGYLALHTLVLGTAMAIIGYTTFATILIRSQANTPMDENNPENLFALLSYLNREQYGDRPLLTGPYFNSPEDRKQEAGDGAEVWVKSFSVREENTKSKLVISCRERFEAEKYVADHPKEKLKVVEEYIPSGEKKGTVVHYRDEFKTVFPRMYSSQANHIEDYKFWSNYRDWNTPSGRARTEKVEQEIAELEYQISRIEQYMQKSADLSSEQMSQFKSMQRALDKKYAEMMPSKGEDLRYFFSYQIGWMYWRYFMWNFAGRQDDQQGNGDFMDGNWVSGVSMIDEERLGNREKLPDMERNNPAHNKYFFLPLILGCIGLVFQLLRHPKDFSVVAMLFLLTGFAILIYLNQTPQQPRERDYAYAGSFYAFTIWIGLGVYALYFAATNLNWKQMGTIAAMSVGGSLVLFAFERVAGSSNAFGTTLLFMSAVACALLALMTALNSIKGDSLVKGIAATLVALPIPMLMAAENWDDHSRANRKTGIAMAINYLNSLESNAIIFTNGDNDTFPLWYAQEVEGIRTDVRVVNLSLLNTDWYIDQMKRRAYESAPVPFTIPEQKYRQGTRDVMYLDPYDKSNGEFMPLSKALAFLLDDKNNIEGYAKPVAYLPNYQFSVPVDSSVVERYRPFLNEGDSLVSEVKWAIADSRGKARSYITKAQMMVLDMIQNNNWERPIYFAVTTGGDAYMGLERYFQLEGLAYRLTPILHKESPNPNLQGGVESDLMYRNMMTRFQWGNMDTHDIYLDENNRRMTTNLRLQFSHLAEQLIEEGKKDSAVAVLDKAMQVMPEKNVPYDQPQIMWHMSELYYDAGDSLKALQLSKRLIELNNQDIDFYESLDPEQQGAMERDIMIRAQINDRLIAQGEKRFPNDADIKAWSKENERVQKMLGLGESREQERPTAPPTPQMPQDTTRPKQPSAKDETVVIGGPKGIDKK
jgi:tetratricopeptide (TPR) repeat protein